MKVVKKTKTLANISQITHKVTKKTSKHTPKHTSVKDLEKLLDSLWIDCMETGE